MAERALGVDGLDARAVGLQGVVHGWLRQPPHRPLLMPSAAARRRVATMLWLLGRARSACGCAGPRDIGVGVVAIDDREEGENVGLDASLGRPW